MSVQSFGSESTDLWKRYARLPPGAKLVMRLKSLVLLPTNKTLFLQCLTRSGARAPDGRAWSSQSLNPVLDALRRENLLTEELACQPNLLHRVSVNAVASAESRAMIAAVRSDFPAQQSYGYYTAPQVDCEAMLRLIRLAIYANDEPDLLTHRDLYDKKCSTFDLDGVLTALFAHAPISSDWLSSRAPMLYTVVLNAKLAAVMHHGVAGHDLNPLVAVARGRQGQDGFAGLQPTTAHFDVLTEQLDHFRSAIGVLADGSGAMRPAWQGVLAFIEARNDEALERFRTALKLHRKALGKRKIFLDGVPAVFFLMALLRANDAALQTEIQAAFESVLGRDSIYGGAFVALETVFWLTQGLDAKSRELLQRLRRSMPTEPLSAACIGLAEIAVDAGLARQHRADIVARFISMKDVLPLIARMHAQVLVDLGGDTKPYTAYLARDTSGIEVSFTRLVAFRQPWERALESLDAFLGAGAAKPEPAAVPRKAKRLVWFLDPETQQIEVAEQSGKGHAGWSDGRAIALKRLHERDSRLDYLTAHDRAALRSLRKDAGGWYDSESYEFDTLRTIPALVGHPAVFDRRQRSQPLELVSYPLELVVADRRRGFHIGLSHTATEPALFLEAETPTRYRVIEFPQ